MKKPKVSKKASVKVVQDWVELCEKHPELNCYSIGKAMGIDKVTMTKRRTIYPYVHDLAIVHGCLHDDVPAAESPFWDVFYQLCHVPDVMVRSVRAWLGRTNQEERRIGARLVALMHPVNGSEE